MIDASLSPNGTKVAMLAPGPQQSTVLQVLDTATNKLKPINVMDGKPFAMRGCNWASDQRLVCSLYGVTNYASGPTLAYQRLVALDPDGANAQPLGARERFQDYVQQTDGYVVD